MTTEARRDLAALARAVAHEQPTDYEEYMRQLRYPDDSPETWMDQDTR